MRALAIMHGSRGSPWWKISLAVALSACGATVVPPRDGGADGPSTSMSPCPRAEPGDGAPCSRNLLECEYGSDPRRECRNRAGCSDTVWRILTPATSGIDRTWCASVPPASCPVTLDAASGQNCTAQGAVCTYGGLLCECTNCRSFPLYGCSGIATWQCDQQPPERGCPAASPRLGDVCSQEGVNCDYGCNSPNGAVSCRNGVWQRGRLDHCPISTRTVKRDIAYVSVPEADALAAQVRATRLATYEYTIPSMAGRRRLGFILEDQPASFASDPERSQVDLYGYTSMLVAAVQSQARQIDALQRQVEDLRRQLPQARSTACRTIRPIR